MAKRAKKICNKPGCNKAIEASDKYCLKHRKSRGRKNSTQRGYNKEWKRARDSYLLQHPLCVQCAKDGIIKVAYAVDHIIPHKGNDKLFWNENNWQALCEVCHNRKSRYE